MKTRGRDQFGPSSRLSGIGVLAIILIVIIVGLVAWTFKRWEGQAPQITMDRELKAVGKNPELNVSVADMGSGLDHVTVRLKQKDSEIILVDEALKQAPSKTYDLGKMLAAQPKLEAGPTTLTIEAVDHALLRFFRGNTASLNKTFTVDVTPPTLEVFSAQHYINQGGSECVVYRVSEDAEVTGVQVGPHFFPGFPVSKSDPKVRFALFALAYDQAPDTKIQVVARDAAGNESTAGFWQ